MSETTNGNGGNGGNGKKLTVLAESPVADVIPITPFPASEKVYVEAPESDVPGAKLRVPVRRISLSGGEPPFDVYDKSGPQGVDPHHGLPKLRAPWIAARRGSANQSQMHFARQGVITPEMRFVAVRESVTPEFVRDEIASRPRDPAREHQPPRDRADDHRQEFPRQDQREHRQQRGRELTIERRGRQAALRRSKWGADTVMDLSTGDPHPRGAREWIVAATRPCRSARCRSISA